jgi:hypothetical protein
MYSLAFWSSITTTLAAALTAASELSFLEAVLRLWFTFFAVFVFAHTIAFIASACGQGRYCIGCSAVEQGPDDAGVCNSPEQNSQQLMHTPVPDCEFYQEYHGHKVAHLERVFTSLCAQGCQRFVFLCGDSSMDNKHWLLDKDPGEPINPRKMNDSKITAPAVNGYEDALRSCSSAGAPRMVKDVSYWFNKLAQDLHGSKTLCTFMSAVEESTAMDRRVGLLPQDEFIRDNVTPQDCIVISVGGLDVALEPTVATAVSMVLLNLSPRWLIWIGLAPGLRHMVHWFELAMFSYIEKLVEHDMPNKVVVNLIYYPDETQGDATAWSSGALRLLGYNTCPGQLQFILRTLHKTLSSRAKTGASISPDLIKRGLHVEVFPLF